MKPVVVIFTCVLALAGSAAAPPVSAAQRQPSATLRVIVHDPSGAVIPGARVQVTRADGASHDIASDGQGVATLSAVETGRYRITVSFPGFETNTINDVRLRPGATRRDVTLSIEKLDQSVSVGRDPSTVASDPNSDRFNTVLSKQQIDALPDDPDEMESALKEMAGPGATIRVDGFRGGRLPPKSQIRSIRFSRDMFAAENHGGGLVFVDITTQPGLGPLRGGLDFTFRDDSLNARNAFVTEKGPEQTQQYAFNLSGTLLKDRTSFSLSAGGASLYDSASILAAVPAGTVNANVRRPSDRVNVTARVDHALRKGHTLRVSFQESQNDQQNLGVGGFNLAERGYARASEDRLFRVGESGSLSRNVFAETRVQLHWTSTDATSASELPTVQVLDAFTAGGAQQAGGRQSTELEWATNVDWAKGKHAVRAGSLVEGGSYRSDTRANYLGTFTFDSLASYQSAQPATFSRRSGDPLVRFPQWQAGLFVQDDWRVKKNLTISGGLRQELQTHLDDPWNVAPRFGLTWSPFKSGKTTVRAGGGIFYDWLDADTYEQTLRVDGERQQDRIVRNPGYPNPFGGGDDQQVLPASKYSLAANLAMPERKMINAGISQQVSSVLSVNVGVNHSVGTDRFRGRNVNAPLADGSRPNPLLGNITQVESTAHSQGDSLNVGLNMNIPNRRTVFFANYTWLHQHNDADGPFSLPADSYDLSGEWGPVAGVPHHVFSGMINTAFRRNIRVGLTTAARSGVPYNVTTGRDDNGDTVFNDRPSGVTRNSAWTKAMWDVGARVSYAFGFGARSAPGGPAGAPTVVIQRIGSVGGATDMLNAMGGGGAEDKRVRFELFASAQNLFNHVNPIGYSGVMTSPFYGQPTAAMPARRIDVGMRIGF